tara:strand:+ start:1555 stop:2031 length:477 start_codon:yes stop_codon:yes gene_type:complete
VTIPKHYKFSLIFLFLFLGCSNISLEKEIEYYESGLKKRELTYKGNILSMTLVKLVNYYNDLNSENPQKLSELNYENSSLNGEQEYWYNDGTKNMVLNYRYGLMHGEQLGWYQNGKNKFKQNYNFGNLEGIQYSYNNSGKIDRKKLYKNGKLIRIIKD